MSDGYAGVLAERRLRLRSRVEAGLIVRASEETLETIVENLVENAVSFSPADGVVSVSLARAESWVELMVEDDGPGVEADNLNRIFERYFSQRQPGHGLPDGSGEDAQADGEHFGIGLWIVRRNVEAFGGRVRAENRAEGGFRMTVALPVVG